MDKLRVLKEGGKDTKIFGAVGEIGDVHQFCDFVERNIYLYNLDDVSAIANENLANRKNEVARCKEGLSKRAMRIWDQIVASPKPPS